MPRSVLGLLRISLLEPSGPVWGYTSLFCVPSSLLGKPLEDSLGPWAKEGSDPHRFLDEVLNLRLSFHICKWRSRRLPHGVMKGLR